MNTYYLIFRNKMNLNKSEEMTISAPSRNQAVARGEALLLSTGKRLQWYQRPQVQQRGEPT